MNKKSNFLIQIRSFSNPVQKYTIRIAPASPPIVSQDKECCFYTNSDLGQQFAIEYSQWFLYVYGHRITS